MVMVVVVVVVMVVVVVVLIIVVAPGAGAGAPELGGLAGAGPVAPPGTGARWLCCVLVYVCMR